MINRFRRIFAEPNTEYLPQVQEDFMPDLSGLEAVMNNLQAQLDATSQYDLPKYLRNSPTDVAAFNQYKANVEGYRDNAMESFKKGDIASGQSALRGFSDYMRKSKMPEGDFFELERGVQEYNASLKELKDTFLDQKSDLYNPYIFQHAKNKLDENIDPFRDEFGNSRVGISAPVLDRYIPDAEVTKQLNEVLDNIESNQIIRGNRVPVRLQGLSFKQLLERGETEYIDFNKVASVLSNTVSPEIIKSYNLLGNAMGLGANQGNFVSEDGKGFNPNTMLGRKLQGLAESKVFTKQKDDAKVITRVGDLEAYKSRLRKSESEFEFKLGSETLRTQVFTNDTGMPELNMSMDKNGNIIKNNPSAFDLNNAGVAPAGLVVNPKSVRTEKIGNIVEYINSEKGRKENPALGMVYDQFARHVQNMPPKQAYEFLKKKYNEKKEKLSVADVETNVYSPKMQDARQKTLIGVGSGAALGTIAQKKITILDQNNRVVKTVPYMEFVDELDIDNETFKKNAMVNGSIETDNPLIVSGEQFTWSDPETGEVITGIASERSLEEMQYYNPLHKLYQPTHKGDILESDFVETGVQAIDEAYGRMKSVARDVYESDIISERLSKPRGLTQGEMNKLNERLSELQRNPELDEMQYRDVQLYDTKGTNLTERFNLTLEQLVDTKKKLLNAYRQGMNVNNPYAPTIDFSIEYSTRQ